MATKYSASRDRSDPNAAANHRKNLRLSLETSLRRLRTGYIDLYYVHIWDACTPIEETMRALDDAVRAGKVLAVGVSDTPAWVLARANTLADWHGWAPFVAVQAPYNLLKRDAEREAVHPILGVRMLSQLKDNLGALDVHLSPEAADRLEAATGFEVGFPSDFLASMTSFVYGEAGALVDQPVRRG